MLFKLMRIGIVWFQGISVETWDINKEIMLASIISIQLLFAISSF